MKFLLHLSPKATGLLRISREPFTAEGRSEEPWRKPGFGKKENRELDPRPPGSHFLQGLFATQIEKTLPRRAWVGAKWKDASAATPFPPLLPSLQGGWEAKRREGGERAEAREA